MQCLNHNGKDDQDDNKSTGLITVVYESVSDPVQIGLISKAQEDVSNTDIHPSDLRRLSIASAESKQQAPKSHSKWNPNLSKHLGFCVVSPTPWAGRNDVQGTTNPAQH